MTLRLYREDREEEEGLLDRVPSKRNILNDSEWSSGRNNGELQRIWKDDDEVEGSETIRKIMVGEIGMIWAIADF